MPTKYADLEIGLSRRDDSVYAVSFRLLRPDSDDTLLERGEIKRAILNPDDFTDALADPKDYGKRLTERFFSEPNITQWYTTYKSMVLAQAVIDAIAQAAKSGLEPGFAYKAQLSKRQ